MFPSNTLSWVGWKEQGGRIHYQHQGWNAHLEFQNLDDVVFSFLCGVEYLCFEIQQSSLLCDLHPTIPFTCGHI